MSAINGEGQWIGRPWIARAIRVFVLVVPFAASVAFAWLLSSLAPSVSTWPMAILRWLLIALASTSVMVAFDRVTRRLLPLAVLLGLTLAFPDQAPSRFKVAMRIGTTLQLRRIVADARAGRVGETPAEAAEKLLELVGALSVHDRLTRGHSERVRAYTHMVGEELKITGPELDHLRWSALLHDIGKLLVSAEILNKPGKLTDAEFEAIKQHPEFGRELVAPLVGWLGDSARAVWEHHERWDGWGYPRGIAGTDISLAGRIVAVTDVFDVMTSTRSYKEPISAIKARAELARCAGTQFDAAIVRAFLNVSLGRLRMAMGPLSWLTQLSFIPQTIATAGASGATALTAVVGLGAGALGVGLSDEGVLSGPRMVHAAPGTTIAVDEPIGLPRAIGVGGVGPASGDGLDGVDDDGSGDDGVDPGNPVADDDGVPGDAEPIGGDVSTTTTSSIPSGTPRAPGSGTTTTTTPRAPGAPTTTNPSSPTTTPATTAPPAGSATTAPVAGSPTTAPATTAPATTAPATTAPATTAPTTAPPTTTTTTTMPPPTPMPDLTLYLTSPGTGNVASQPVLPLTTGVPNASSSPNYDTDRNGNPWLTLKPGDPPATAAQRFEWVASSLVRFHGTAGATLWLTGPAPGLLQSRNLVVDVQLRRCSAGVCSTVATVGGSSSGPVLDLLGVLVVWNPVALNFGAIDVVLGAGESLELVVTARAGSDDVWLAYDASAVPSRFTFDQS